MPFYKKQGDQIISQESVTITLTEANKDDFKYPIDGWHWFKDEQAAKQRIIDFIYEPGSDEYEAMIKETDGRR